MRDERGDVGIVALDLFSGTGWGVACKQLGIEEYGVEIMPEACETRENNGMQTVLNDVFDGLLYATATAKLPIGYDLLIASPPCQTFSLAGNGAGRRALDDVLGAIDDGAYRNPWMLRMLGVKHDPRTALVLTPLAYVYRDRPRFVVLEQVPPVLPIWERCADEMRAWGYSVWTGNLQAEQYGVPQTRKRAILIARRDGVEAAPPVPTHSRYYPRDPKRLDPGVLPWISMAEALGWGMDTRPAPTVTGGGTETGGAEPIAHLYRYTTDDGWRPRTAVEGDASWVYNRPSPTIVGSFRPDVVASPGWRKAGDGPRQSQPGSVRITVEEAAALQSYPPGFTFAGTKTKQFLQVGNAVPPLLAKVVLEALVR